MNDIENDLWVKRNEIDVRNVELIIDKKISDAKLEIAEKRMSHLVTIGAAFLTIFGLIIPIFISLQSENKVEKAIDRMELKFSELAGTQLRKPKMSCYINETNLTNSTMLIRPEVEKAVSGKVIVKNIGDGTAENIKIRLYINSDDDDLKKYIGYRFDMLDINDKPEFKWVYLYSSEDIVLPPKDSFSFDIMQFMAVKVDSEPISKNINAIALLKIFYNEPTPIEIPFSIKIEKNDNQGVEKDAK